MKKYLNFLLLIFMFTFSLVACGSPANSENGSSSYSSIETVEKHTVRFYVEDELYKTLKVEDNTTIGSKYDVEAPLKEGYAFASWVDKNNEVIDLNTYVVTEPLKLYATFEEVITDDTLIVNGVKEEGANYYLVVGWWETTALNDDGSPKVTSSLTNDTVRLFYSNLNLYLEAYGATNDQIKAVQFRDYSTETVEEMGAKINADGDVDLVIGVGNNINSKAGVTLFEDNDGKTTAPMGTEAKSRTVALPNHDTMNNVAISVFDWIKTDVGQTAFTKQLSASDIIVVPERTDEVNVTVTIHGDNGETKVTTMTSKSDVIELPTITVPEGYKFLGYATTSDATAAEIVIGLGVALTYADIEGILNGASSIDLYPIFAEEVINTEFDLVVYIHVTSTSSISENEANLLALRFEESLTEEKNINYVWVTEGKAADFVTRINDDIAAGETIDVVIGGNASTKLLTALDETHINATCGAKHFANTSRKIIVLQSAASTHVDLAKQFYSFMTTEAPVLKLSVAFWTKNYTWVTETELTSITEGVTTYVNDLFVSEDVTDAFETYSLEIAFHNTVNTAVADLSAETKALNDGNGVGLIVGTGGNATNESNMGSDIIEQKDCPTSLVAAGRKVAICEDNFIYKAIYDNYFAESSVSETPTY